MHKALYEALLEVLHEALLEALLKALHEALLKALHEALHEALLKALHEALHKALPKLYIKLTPFCKANIYLLVALKHYLKPARRFGYSGCGRKRAAVVVGEMRLLRLGGVGRDNETANWNRANQAT